MTPLQFNFRRKLKKLWKIVGPRMPDQVYFEDRIEQYKTIWGSVAADIDAKFETVDEDIWRISLGNKSVYCFQYLLSLDNPVTLELAGRKSAVYGLLQERGIPVPEHIAISAENHREARGFLARFPRGVVVKPNAGYGGKGVTTHVASERDLIDAAISASIYDRKILVEEQVYGECFRALVFRGKVLSIVRRTGLRIIGDGSSTISTLANQSGYPGMNDDLEFCLLHAGKKPDSVLTEGETVLVRCVGDTFRSGSELRTIYDTDVTESVAPEVVDQVCTAAAAVDSEFAGVDLITSDITVALKESAGVVNEVNTTPALHHHYDSRVERYPVAARTIVEELLGVNG